MVDTEKEFHWIVSPDGPHSFGSGLYETLLDTRHSIVDVGKNKMSKKRGLVS